MSTTDIDRDAAHDAAQAELSKSIYPKPSATDLISDWFQDILYRLTSGASQIPGGWFTIAVLVVLLAVAAIVAVRIARRAMRTSRSTALGLFDDPSLSAAEHRATAEHHAAAHEWAPAIRHRVRAIARQLEEDGVLGPVPGRTATELALDAGQAIPPLATELDSAAAIFNDVTYGGRAATEDQYQTIADLDTTLSRHRAVGSHPPMGDGAHQPWAQVR